MVGFFHGVINTIDWINRKAGLCAGWVGCIMVALVTGDVIMRYLFNTSYVFIQELEWYLFGVLFLLGAGYTLYVDGHVRVDVLYQRFGRKGQAWVNLLGVLLFLLPGCVVVLDTSWQFFMQSVSQLEGSPDPGGIPARFVLKFFIPLSFLLIGLQGISLALKSVLTIMGQPCGEAPPIGRQCDLPEESADLKEGGN